MKLIKYIAISRDIRNFSFSRNEMIRLAKYHWQRYFCSTKNTTKN